MNDISDVRTQRFANQARDELLWLTGRIDQETGDGELLDEAREVVSELFGDTDGKYSDGSPVWTVYMFGDDELNRYLNRPPHRREERR